MIKTQNLRLICINEKLSEWGLFLCSSIFVCVCLLIAFEAMLLLGFRVALFNLFAVIICEPVLGTKMPLSC